MKESVRDRIRELPDCAGIYIFVDHKGEPLYVGKAKSLRKRVASYLNVTDDARLRAMTDEARDVEFLATDTEAAALELENTWIKTRQPPFNIRLRDDKTYPYLKLTLQDEYPRLVFTRHLRKDGAEYFGPYLPGGLARRAIKLVQKLFQVRVCHIKIDGQLPRPCLYHDMKRCLGPCVEGLTNVNDYSEAVQEARQFLAGHTGPLIQALKKKMLAASKEQAFEAAARHRDLLAEIETISAKRRITRNHADDVDIFGVHIAANHGAVTQLLVRNGQLMDRRDLFFEEIGSLPPERLLAELLPQVYDRTTFVPRELHLPFPIEGEESLLGWLAKKRGAVVSLRLPSRGSKARRVAMAMENSKLAFRRRFRLSPDQMAGAEALRDVLELPETPRRIEGFDISNFQGAQTVASMVVWSDGRMNKREYRSFNIRGLSQPDDFFSMHQAVHRRYRRLLDEGRELPDLILVDGGKGQLSSALEALASLGLDEVAVVGLAKREEEIFVPLDPRPLVLDRSNDGLKTLQRIRDEAHRFAVARHRARRSKASLRSRFDDLVGIGDKRRKLLVRTFGSFRGVKGASREDLSKALGERLGRKVFVQLHPSPKGGDHAAVKVD